MRDPDVSLYRFTPPARDFHVREVLSESLRSSRCRPPVFGVLDCTGEVFLEGINEAPVEPIDSLDGPLGVSDGLTGGGEVDAPDRYVYQVDLSLPALEVLIVFHELGPALDRVREPPDPEDESLVRVRRGLPDPQTFHPGDVEVYRVRRHPDLKHAI